MRYLPIKPSLVKLTRTEKNKIAKWLEMPKTLQNITCPFSLYIQPHVRCLKMFGYKVTKSNYRWLCPCEKFGYNAVIAHARKLIK